MHCATTRASAGLSPKTRARRFMRASLTGEKAKHRGDVAPAFNISVHFVSVRRHFQAFLFPSAKVLNQIIWYSKFHVSCYRTAVSAQPDFVPTSFWRHGFACLWSNKPRQRPIIIIILDVNVYLPPLVLLTPGVTFPREKNHQVKE